MNIDEVKVGGYQVLTLLMLCVNLAIVGMSHALGIFYKYRPDFHCQDDVLNATSTIDEANRTSVAHDWKLFCDEDQHLLDASGNVYFGGMLLGGIVAGLLMDRLGRTMLMAICLYAQGTMAVALNMVKHYSLFLTFRGLQGFFTQGLESSSYILGIELFPSKYRALVALIGMSARSVGLAALAGLDYAILDWRVLQLVVAVPTALTVAYVWLIPESARWLAARHRLTDAVLMIERIDNYNALFSRKPPAPEKPKRRTIDDECDADDVEKSAEAENLLEETEGKIDEGKTDLDAVAEEEITSLEEKDDQPNMLASKETLATEDIDKMDAEEEAKSVVAIKRFFEERFIGRTCLVLMCLWFACSVAFHALISMPHKAKLERHVSLAIAAVVELVTFAFGYLLISSRCGRRVPLCAGQTIAGAVCVAVAVMTMVVTDDSDLIAQSKIAIVKIGAIANIICFFVLRIATIELFPTISRGTGLGLCVAAEMLAGLVTNPLITKVNDFVANKKLDVSRISIGLFCICVAFLTVILSETARLRTLPDSAEDAKNEKGNSGETDCEQSKNPEKLRKKLFSEDWVDAGNGIIVNFTENKTVD